MSGSPANEPQNIRSQYRINSDRIPEGIRAWDADQTKLEEIFQTQNALWVYIRGGTVNVTVDQPNKFIYAEQTIVKDTTDTILSYNPPAAETGRIISAEFYGDAKGEWVFYKNGSIIGRAANSFMRPSASYDLRGETYTDTDLIEIACNSQSFGSPCLYTVRLLLSTD